MRLTQVTLSNKSVVFILFTAALLTAIGFFIPVQGFWVTDCGMRYLQLINILDRHHFGGFWLDYPLSNEDPNYELLPMGRIQTFVHNGRLFAQYPPWFNYVCAPFYAVLGKVGLRVLPLVAAFLLLWSTYATARFLGHSRPGLATLGVLFATPIFPYVYIYWDLIPALAFAVTGQYFFLQAVRCESFRDAVLSSFFLWLAFVMREEYLLWTAGFFAAALGLRFPIRLLITTAVLFFTGALIVMAVNMHFIGSPLFFRAITGRSTVWDYTWSLSSRGWVAYRYMATVTGEVFRDCGIFVALCGLAFLPLAQRPVHQLALCLAAFIAALYVRTISWDFSKPVVTSFLVNSFASASPIAFLGLRLWQTPMRNSEGAGESRWLQLLCLTATIFLGITLWLSIPNSAVGLNFGPRLLLPVYPAFMLGAATVVESVWRQRFVPLVKYSCFVLCGLVILGVFDSLFYLVRLSIQQFQIERMRVAMESTEPHRAILTEKEWLATMLPELFYQRPIMAAWDAQRGMRALDVAKKLSPEGVLVVTSKSSPPRWLSQAKNIEQIDIASKVKFVDTAFSFYLFRASIE